MKDDPRQPPENTLPEPKIEYPREEGAGPSSKKRRSEDNGSPSDRTPKHLVLSRRAAFLWGMGLGVFMIWIFTLGILVGRGYIFQNKAFKDLERRIGRPAAKGTPPVTIEQDSLDIPPPKPRLTFYKSLAGKETQENIDSLENRQRRNAAHKTQEDTAPRGTMAAVSGSANGNMPMKRPADRSQPSDQSRSLVRTIPKETSLAPPPARSQNERFTIQVAAFWEIGQAEQLTNSLKGKGYSAYFYHARTKTREYFRVRVGGFNSQVEAEAVLARLKMIGFADAFISRLVE